MDSVECRSGRRRRKPAVEGLESRCLLSTSTVRPDIVMDAATTSDSRSVSFQYDIKNAPVTQPITFVVDRSAGPQAGSGATQVASIVVDPAGVAGPARDAAGNLATAPGHHEIKVPVPGGLPPDPHQPYVVVTANPGGTVAESNTANDSASFRTYVIGVITHGGVQPKSWKVSGPPWEQRMATDLKAQGYDAVVAFNWVGESNHPGAAAQQAPRLVSMILAKASEFPANAPIDLHFIGHSEGTVINSLAIQRMNKTQAWTPALQAGYLKLTMLDPHAASNGVHGQQYSVSNGLLGLIARGEINSFQSKAKDPAVVVPPNVQDAEVFYQHTPVSQSGGSNSGIYNLWGQVPVHGPADYFNLTAPGISHSGKFGVQDWYRLNVVPTLGDGAPFVQTDTLTGSVVSLASAGGQAPGALVSFGGHAAPGATVRLFAARTTAATLAPEGRTVANPDGTWTLTTRRLSPGSYRVVAESNAPAGPRGRPATMKPIAWLGPVTIP